MVSYFYYALFTLPQIYYSLFSDSESESEDDSDRSDTNLFYSAYDVRKKNSMKQNQVSSIPKAAQSLVVLSVNIGQGLAVLNPPARESGSHNVMPGQQGEFLLRVEDANIFVVSGYEGDENLSFVCVQVHSANLSHCGELNKINVRIDEAFVQITN